MTKAPSSPAWPADEEIKPAVLDYLQNLLGVSTMDLYYLIGLGRGAARRTVATSGGRTSVADPALALLVRYYLHFPDIARQLIPPTPHPKEVFEQLNAGCDEDNLRVSKRRFALLLGRNATFPTQAFQPYIQPTALMARLLFAISQDIRTRGPAEALKNLEAFAESEMRIRELSFVSDAGTWRPSAQRKRNRLPARKAAHPAKATARTSTRIKRAPKAQGIANRRKPRG